MIIDASNIELDITPPEGSIFPNLALSERISSYLNMYVGNYGADQYCDFELDSNHEGRMTWKSGRDGKRYIVWVNEDLPQEEMEQLLMGTDESSRLFVIPKDEEEQLLMTRDVLKRLHPDKRMEILSVNGSSAIIYYDVDDPTVVYKVSRPHNEEYDEEFAEEDRELRDIYVINEAVNLVRLSKEGAAASINGFVPNRTMDDEMLKRIPSELNVMDSEDLAIIVMERIYNQGIKTESLPKEIRSNESKRIRTILLKSGLVPGDVELIYDAAKNRIVFIDCGGFRPVDEDGIFTEHDLEWLDEKLIRDLKL